MALSKFVACTIGAVALITAAACADGTGKALTPTLPTTGSSAANPDGTLLKATAPQPRSPISGVRVATLTPELRLANGSGSYDPSAALSYQFQVLEGSTVVAESENVPAGNSETSWTVPADRLKHNIVYVWRGRAIFGSVTGSWAADLVSFRTPLPPPPPSDAPGAVPCAGNTGPEIIECVKDAYPEKLVATSNGDFSDERRADNMAFMRDRIIETGRCKGLDLGRNFKRGTPVISHDFIVWRRPGHHLAGVDIARGYDNNRVRLQLGWQVWGPPSYGHPFFASYNVPFTCPE
jgi:hypothetical protein